MAPEKPTRTRKRVRKRKRRNISSSSSSSSTSSSEDEAPRTAPAPPKQIPMDVDAEDAESSSSSSSTSSSIASVKQGKSTKSAEGPSKPMRRRIRSRSPSPPTVEIPPLLPPNPVTDAEKEKEKALKEKFRKFWMASIADGFEDDLDEIRKEPNLSTARLSLLIDSLASGAEVFSASSQPNGSQINEMELVVGSTESN